MANKFKFNAILDEDGRVSTLSSTIDIFSANSSQICNWISELNGNLENYNTARFHSLESFSEFSRRLSSLTLPRISKKR